jgi:acyl-CoA hydrolase
MPRTHGDSFLHIDNFDAVVEVDEPLPEAPSPAMSEDHRAVGRNIAELIDDGATLQLGVGAIPNAVLAMLTSHRDLGIHSEVVSCCRPRRVGSGRASSRPSPPAPR